MKKVIMIMAVMLGCLTAHAQQQGGAQGHFSPEAFMHRLETEVKEHAKFTDEEAARFFPIFHEMQGKLRGLNMEAAALKRDTKASDGDEVSAKAIKRITAIKMEAANIEQTYYERLCKTVPPAKVLRAMKAEDKFHRDMLKQFSGRKEGGHTARKK